MTVILRLEPLEDRRLLSFQAGLNSDAGPYPYAVAVGDVNGDGIPDLVVADSGDYRTGKGGAVSVLLGNGDGSFQPARSFATGLFSTAVAIGDFNGDGIPDLAVVNEGNQFHQGSGVSVLLGNGDGTFQPAVNYTVGDTPCSVAVGDFNGDGTLDLVVANYGTDNVSVLLGNGDGTFQPPANYSAGRGPETVVVGDFYGDGMPDLAVADYGFMNVDRGGVSILRGNGDGTFQPPVSYSVGTHPISLAVGDFAGNGRDDLAVVTDAMVGVGGGRSVSALLSNGDGTFQTLNHVAGGSTLWSVAAGDFNADGYQDLVVTDLLADRVSVFLSNGDGSFQPGQTYAVGSDPAGVAVGDLNGDGLPDLAVANFSSNDVSVLLNDGNWPPAAGLPDSSDGMKNRDTQAEPLPNHLGEVSEGGLTAHSLRDPPSLVAWWSGFDDPVTQRKDHVLLSLSR